MEIHGDLISVDLISDGNILAPCLLTLNKYNGVKPRVKDKAYCRGGSTQKISP
jgi:hypothetical protein